MPALALDLRDTTALIAELERASAELAVAEAVPARAAGVVRELHEGLAEIEPSAWQPYVDPYFFADLQQAAMAARAALDLEPEGGRVAALELAVEGVLDVLVDIADGAAVREERPATEVAAWLKRATGATGVELAGLLGISERKLDRWLSARDPSAPSGDDELRLRLIARLVNQLRHAMTGRGALRWLTTPSPELGGGAPNEALLDPAAAARLFSAARATRVSDAA
jgi:hypothetical protein